ncbi:hypothetical protein J6590_077706 [Homalodisca vitripennis]|nr:hypothetical protein J6590_077706 [Homalodisca vitripennis]
MNGFNDCPVLFDTIALPTPRGIRPRSVFADVTIQLGSSRTAVFLDRKKSTNSRVSVDEVRNARVSKSAKLNRRTDGLPFDQKSSFLDQEKLMYEVSNSTTSLSRVIAQTVGQRRHSKNTIIIFLYT